MLYASENVHYKLSFNSEEQLDVVGLAGFFGGIVNMLVGVIIPQLISKFGTDDHGWTIIALVFAVPCTVMGILKLFLLPETQETKLQNAEKQNSVPLRRIPGLLFRNKFLLLFLGAMLCRTVVFNMSSAGTYYYTYVVGDVKIMSLTNTFAMVSMFIMPFIPFFSRKLGIKKFVVLSILIGAITMSMLLFSSTNIILLSLYIIGNSIGNAPLGMLSTIMSVQCMKYTEWKNGVTIDGVIASCSGFVQKIGAALGAFVIGICLTIGGYSGSLEIQPASALTAIKFMYIGIPVILFLAIAFLMKSYKLDEMMPEIEKELESSGIENKNE